MCGCKAEKGQSLLEENYCKGIHELFSEKEIGIEMLMIAATVGSAILGMWDEAAFLVFLYGAAEGLEEYTYAKTRSSIRNLLDLAPNEARILRNGKEIIIPAEELREEDVFLGKQELFQAGDQLAKPGEKIEALRKEGKTLILVGTENRVKGLIAIRDVIRENAPAVIERLHRMGIKITMLTGDNRRTAEAFAREQGISDVRADLKPEEKLEAIELLKQQYGTVAMVGDGINDAPALALASVGIAMGAVGADAAIEAADTALMADDLNKVLFARTLGKRARKISTQNIIFSLLVLAVLIPSALIGMMTVAMAVFFHETSELLAVANGLRTGHVL